jgi:phage repressor protein C with HTH and peptisase S24 domain
MEKETGFSYRVKQIRQALKISRDEFGKRSKVSGAYIGQLESGKKLNPSDLFLENASREFNLNPVWLKTGEGNMFREGGDTQGVTRKGTTEISRGQGLSELGHYDINDFVEMQVYLTGGAGAPYEFIPSEPIEVIIVPRSYAGKSVVPVKVRGRSMEKTLRDGAVVGVDRDDRYIVNGDLFAVWLPYQGTVIKRLYLDNKKIRLHSDNEEFRSSDIEIALDAVDDNFVQGRVKWVMQEL